jgi:hypothetical protein
MTIQSMQNIIENDDVTAVDSGRAHLVHGEKVLVTLKMKLTGKSGAAGTEPPWFKYAKACGCKVDVDSGTSTTLRPWFPQDMTNAPSISLCIVMLDDSQAAGSARVWYVTGGRGNFVLSGESGGKGEIEFTFEALYLDYPSASALPTIPEGYSGEKSALPVAGSTHQVGGTDYPMTAFDLNTNWSIVPDDCANADALVDEIYLDREPGNRMGGSITYKGRAAMLNAIIPLIESGAESAMSQEYTDGTDTIAISIPKAQFGNWSATKEGRWKYDVPYFANGEWDTGKAGNNEFAIVAT